MNTEHFLICTTTFTKASRASMDRAHCLILQLFMLDAVLTSDSTAMGRSSFKAVYKSCPLW